MVSVYPSCSGVVPVCTGCSRLVPAGPDCSRLSPTVPPVPGLSRLVLICPTVQRAVRLTQSAALGTESCGRAGPPGRRDGRSGVLSSRRSCAPVSVGRGRYAGTLAVIRGDLCQSMKRFGFIRWINDSFLSRGIWMEPTVEPYMYTV